MARKKHKHDLRAMPFMVGCPACEDGDDFGGPGDSDAGGGEAGEGAGGGGDAD